MKPEFTSTGLDIQTHEEIFEELSDGYKSIYGADISIDADDPDGQRIGIESNHILDMQLFAAYLYNSLDPDFASGTFLDAIIKFCGIFRRPASQSQWDLEITVSSNVTLPATYTVKDDLDQEWVITGETAITSSPVTVSFLSSTYGAVVGQSGASIEQVTFEPKVTGITVSGSAVVGISEETDEELRIRRNKSLLNPSYSTTGGLLAKLLNTPGVTDAAVYDNSSSDYDAELDMDAHTIWCVVEGGDSADIVETIVFSKTQGVNLKGTVVANYLEEIQKPDLSVKTISHPIRYDRPASTPIYVTVNARRKNASISFDADAIADAIAEWTTDIGGSVIASELYAYGYAAGSTFILSDLEISDDDIIYTDEILSGVPGAKYSILPENVTITELF